MAGPEESTMMNQVVSSVAEEENVSDHRSSEESHYHITAEKLLASDQATGEQKETLESNTDTADQRTTDSHSVTENGGKDTENESDINVADIDEPVESEERETEVQVEQTAEVRGETQGSEGQVHGETEESEGQAQTSELHDRLLRLPASRIKHIIKMDPDVNLASQEAVATITKAAELFISELSRDACYKTIQGRRRIVLRKDLQHIMDTRDCYAFLEGAMDS